MHVEGTQAGEGAMAGTAVTGGQSGPPVVAATAADCTTRAIAGRRCGAWAYFQALSGVLSVDLGLLRLPAAQERLLQVWPGPERNEQDPAHPCCAGPRSSKEDPAREIG